MIQRTFSADLLNKVANDPAVFRWIASPGVERFDVSDVAADPANYVLTNEHGGFVCVPRGNGTYEIHTQFLPSIKGRAIDAALELTRFMFTQTDCTRLISYVPLGNERARKLVESAGFTGTGRDGSFTYLSGETVPLDWYELTKEDWKCL